MVRGRRREAAAGRCGGGLRRATTRSAIPIASHTLWACDVRARCVAGGKLYRCVRYGTGRRRVFGCSRLTRGRQKCPLHSRVPDCAVGSLQQGSRLRFLSFVQVGETQVQT
jgi:hypothetical protein